MQNLVIVESPTKARTLSRFLGKDYRIEATMGHIRDLPVKRLGINIKLKAQSSKLKATAQSPKLKKEEYEFFPQYQIISGRKKRVKELSEIAEKSKGIILATDPDREGEAIAYHFFEVIRSKSKIKNQKSKSKPTTYSRIVFHEITKSAVTKALENPKQIDMQLVDAQQARRILDRLVGYKLSPLLWNKLGMRWLSAGRVQSVTVRLIVEREREREKFKSQEYWRIEGMFKTNGQEIKAQLTLKDGIPYEKTISYDLFDGKYRVKKTTIADKKQAEEIIKDLKAPFIVSSVDKKEIRRFPLPPFMTSTLQQEAGHRFHFSSKKTMQLAQKLYEEGLITYHRTDSFHLSEKFTKSARNYIGKVYGKDYLPEKIRIYRTKSKVAQEAHEAIRPTDVALKPKDIKMKKNFFRDHFSLYELIWKRALASQAKEAVFDSTTINILDKKNYQFETQGSIIKFDGFLKILGRSPDETIIPDVLKGQEVFLLETVPSQHFTSPPPRYTEASLVKTLEEKGIGRPSTYAPIISTIQNRRYVAKEEKKFFPTKLGELVVDFLVKYFPDIVGLVFTAKMEDELDEIASGKLLWNSVLSKFYAPFSDKLEKVFQKGERVKVDLGETKEKCPKCGGKLVIRLSKYGKFLACSNFPKCKFTKNILDKTGIKCPKCKGDMVLKRTRKGRRFYGCSNYPKCKFAAWKKEEIK